MHLAHTTVLGLREILTSSAISGSKIPTLSHETRNHAVEARALEVQFDSLSAHTLLPSAQGFEVLSGLWYNVIVESKLDTPRLRRQVDWVVHSRYIDRDERSIVSASGMRRSLERRRLRYRKSIWYA